MQRQSLAQERSKRINSTSALSVSGLIKVQVWLGGAKNEFDVVAVSRCGKDLSESSLCRGVRIFSLFYF